MKRILYLFNVGRIERLGTDCPSEFFYGALEFDPQHYRVRLLAPHPPSQGLIGEDGAVYPLPAPLRLVPGALKRSGLTALTFVTRLLQVAIAGRGAVREADLIVAVTSPWIFAVNLLRRLRLLKQPFIGIAFGPFPAPRSIRQRAAALIRRALFKGATVVFTGDEDRENYLRQVGGRRENTAVLYFGVDENFWAPRPDAESNYVFAIGSAFRDYDTLLAAWRGRNAKLTIVSATLAPETSPSANIEFRSGIWHSSGLTDGDIRDLFQGARYVVTPLQDTGRPAGQSATLQAMACGKAVILTRTAGLWDPETMTHLENCYLVAPGDVAAMRSAIEYFESRPDEVARIGRNARETVQRHYTTSGFARQLEAFAAKMLEAA